jgi:hypothetical protein
MSSTSPELVVTPANLPAPLALAPPAFARGDDPATYDRLLARMSDAVRPDNIIEEIWLRDVVDHVWETMRLRHRKAGLINANAGEGMRDILLALNCDNFSTVAREWFARDPDVVTEVEGWLATAGVGINEVMAQTLRRHLADYEGMDRMLQSAEVRRDAALHEIERRRAHFAALLRRAAHDAEAAEAPVRDAEFEVVQTGQRPEAGG